MLKTHFHLASERDPGWSYQGEARGQETSRGWMAQISAQTEALRLQGPADRCTHLPHSLGFTPGSCLVPLPSSMPLSYGSPPGHPAAPGSKLASRPTDLVEFEAINYKEGGKRGLQLPVPLPPLERIIRAWEGPTLSRPAWTSALSRKQPPELLVSNHHNHQSWNYPQFLHSGWHKSKAGNRQDSGPDIPPLEVLGGNNPPAKVYLKEG